MRSGEIMRRNPSHVLVGVQDGLLYLLCWQSHGNLLEGDSIGGKRERKGGEATSPGYNRPTSTNPPPTSFPTFSDKKSTRRRSKTRLAPLLKQTDQGCLGRSCFAPLPRCEQWHDEREARLGRLYPEKP